MTKSDCYEVIEGAKTKDEALAATRFKVGTPAVVCGVKLQSNGSKGWVVIPEFSITDNLATNPSLVERAPNKPTNTQPSVRFDSKQVSRALKASRNGKPPKTGEDKS